MTVFDPGLGLRLGVFAAIPDAAPAALPSAITPSYGLQSVLDGTAFAMVRTTDELTGQGAANIAEHRRAIGSVELTYRLVVVNSYPRGITPAVQQRCCESPEQPAAAASR